MVRSWFDTTRQALGQILLLWWAFPALGAASNDQPLLPPSIATGHSLVTSMYTLLKDVILNPEDFILFVRNENITLDIFDKDLVSVTPPYLFLHQRCFYSKLPSHNEPCMTNSMAQEFGKAMNEQIGISRPTTVIVFLDSGANLSILNQLFVLNEIIAQKKVTHDFTNFLLVIIGDVPSELETKEIFSHLSDCSIQSTTQALVRNVFTCNFETYNLKCRYQVKSTRIPRLMYSPFQRSMLENYLLYLKDDESQLLKEMLHKILPEDSVTECVSNGTKWVEKYETTVYFERFQGSFGEGRDVCFLYPHFQNDFCFMARRARQLTFMESLWLLFPPDAWTLVSLTMLGVSLTHWLVMRMGGNSAHIVIQLATAALEAICCLVTGAFSNWTGRVLFLPLLVSVASLILSNGFCGDFASIFTVPVYGREINTLEEMLAEIDIVYYNMKEVDERFIKENSFMSGVTLRLIEHMSFIDKVSQDDRTAAFLRESDIKRFIYNPVYAKGGRPLLHQVQQCLYSPAYQIIQLSKSSSYALVLNSRILRSIQAGL